MRMVPERPGGDTGGPWIDRINLGQLAKAPGGPPGADVGLDGRLVLECRNVHRLGGVRRRAIPLARPSDVRSAHRVPAPYLAASRGLEEIRTDLQPRSAVGEAGAEISRTRGCRSRRRPAPVTWRELAELRGALRGSTGRACRALGQLA